jgi:hypothetical protein
MQGTSAAVEVEEVLSLLVAIEEDPLLVANAKFSYSEMLALLETLDFHVGSKQHNKQCVLPPELAKQVIQFLIIQRVDSDTVEVVGCSSHDKVHSLQACLSDDENTWWISGEHTMPRGRGCEYLELSVGPKLRRLTAVSIKIPPLPQGPLSVREFRIEAPSTTSSSTSIDGESTEWTAVSPVFTVANRTGYQRFMLSDPVLDVSHIRLVCLTNQIDPYVNVEDEVMASDHVPRRFECVGFFSVRLE